MEDFQKGMANLYDSIPKSTDELNARIAELEEKLKEFEILQKIEDMIGVPKLYIFAAGATLNIILLITGLFYKLLGVLMTRFTGFAYPAYASFKAIESEDKEDDTQWLTYWFVFACFTMLEETILKPLEAILPVYFLFKSLFCLWCCLPQTRGAELIYRQGTKYVDLAFEHAHSE